ncbi:MAG: hypothetical protein GQE15_27015 [Archangiaceae bacterium]|nr:hypothetical protein [Archangiaceae bacterium]
MRPPHRSRPPLLQRSLGSPTRIRRPPERGREAEQSLEQPRLSAKALAIIAAFETPSLPKDSTIAALQSRYSARSRAALEAVLSR